MCEAVDYVFWPLTSRLTGALLATLCNKVVVLLLGTSGALTYFAPVQPALGALSVVLAGAALSVRLRGFFAGCRLPQAAAR